jgi:hypothetical protein
MSDGISGFGTTIAGTVAGTIGELEGLTIPGSSTTSIDMSTMESPDGYKEFVSGMTDPGEMKVHVLFEGSNEEVLMAAVGVMQTWTITLPDGSTWVCDGFVSTGPEIVAEKDTGVTSSFSIKLSGLPEFTAAS